MKKIFATSSLIILMACASNQLSQEQVKNKVYNNTFDFIVSSTDSRTTFSTPAGTGRILTSNMPTSSSQQVGISVSADRLVINLPLDDKKSNKSAVELTSYDFTVARKDLENGNILVNYFLNDQKEINLVKMEVSKSGKIDCSLEGPDQKPLLYVGNISIK